MLASMGYLKQDFKDSNSKTLLSCVENENLHGYIIYIETLR